MPATDPVVTSTDAQAPSSSSQNAQSQPAQLPSGSQPSQKSMRKAKNRGLQERQRAAKAATKQQPGGGKDGQQKQRGGPKHKDSTGSSLKPPPKTTAPKNNRPRSESIAVRATADAGAGDSSSSSRTGLRIFTHFGLSGLPTKQVKAAGGDSLVHPAITRLALMFGEFKICGANARCIATLTAFKTVIQDYTTPPNTTLSRHLMSYLSPQITHLVMARPMSVTMGNAIRQLKLEISGSDFDLPEQDAKDALCRKIDDYIRDRIIYADEVIEDLAVEKIKNGDVIMTYARSSIVEKILLRAHRCGKQFSVIVIDSRPLLEGKELLR
ncbi:hypothetical protein AAF712_015714 [Marasmius tenuissimus]|uniref:Translation initiation factor eIF2B subunit delta n=1 Tax=Marasmius tenuissimus TaxID=585030 RepID=A0ABR2Z8N2_9AGAR